MGRGGGGKLILRIFIQIQLGGDGNMAKRTEQGDRETTVMMVASGGGSMLGMLTTTDSGAGNKEGSRRRRGRKTTELNWNQIMDRS